jgi:hypothetical protein
MPLVQYIVLRKDLITCILLRRFICSFLLINLAWTIGSICAQVGHVVTKCFKKFEDDPEYKKYLLDENIDQMVKIVLEVIFD